MGTALALSALAQQVSAAAWQALTYRAGHKGPLAHQAGRLPVWRWKDGQAQAQQVLISRELDGTHVKDSRCHTPPTMPVPEVARALHRQRQRSWMERVFQEAKPQLGLHQNQTRSWPAWQHHVALTRRTLHLLFDTQLSQREALPNLSFASLKLLLAQKLQNILHQNDALLAAVQQRAQANAPKQPHPHGPYPAKVEPEPIRKIPGVIPRQARNDVLFQRY